MANKVTFGLSNVHVGTWTVDPDNGTVTLGTPMHIPGAVSWTPSQDSDRYDFYADNIPYWSDYADGPVDGDLEVALFPDTFKTTFLGYRTLSDGGLAQIKNATKPHIYLCGEIEGDDEKRRFIFYNGTCGVIGREANTITDSKEVQTETLPMSFVGDNTTGAVKATYKPGDTGYSTLFTAPTAPAF